MTESHVVRQYETGDREGYLALFETVLGSETGEGDGRGSDEWFSWKYETNPYVDHVPIFVAEADGEIVGARSFLALRVAAGEADALALQPCDTMVHPSHRRQGLFTRMTDAAIEQYADSDAAFFFNFPNELTLAGNRKLGWRVVDEGTTYHLVRRPGSLLPDRRGTALLGRLVTAVARGWYAVKKRVTAGGDERVEVRRFDEVPETVLESLYNRGVPERIHAKRDEQFYRWRFGSPAWEYETYVAMHESTPTASVVVGTPVGEDRATRLTDVLPLTDASRREPAFDALVSAVVSDATDSDLISVRRGVIPERLLSSFGFRPDDSPPLSWFSTPTTLVTRPIADDASWDFNGRALTRPGSWLLSFCEQDTS